MIVYKKSKKISSEKLFALYESVGWTKNIKNKKRHGELLSRVYASSDGVVSAWNGKDLIGVVRFVTDKYAHGILFGLAVHPNYRDQKIGTALVNKCLKTNQKIQWSAQTEGKKSRELFEYFGFSPSSGEYVKKGICPV